MGSQVVVGAGPIGSAVARKLLAADQDVVVVTRSGGGPDGARKVALDVADGAAFARIAAGADALYNCANPAYNRWSTDWPPIAASMLSAAETSGAVLVIASNLYGYGPVTGVMTPDLPLAATSVKGRVRAKMWQDALAAHQAGRVQAVEVRGSDYVGPGAESHLDRVLPALLQAKKVRVIGDADTAHSWTHTEDMAAALVAVGMRPEVSGRAWHAPRAADRSQREALTDAARLAGLGEPRVAVLPAWQIRMAGWFNPVIAELPEISYQFTQPFRYDDAQTRTELGLEPTAWAEVLGRSIRAVTGTGTLASHVAS